MSEADVERGEVAALHGEAHGQVANRVCVEHEAVVAPEEVREDEDDDANERHGRDQLVDVLGDGLDHVLRRFVDVHDQDQMETLG